MSPIDSGWVSSSEDTTNVNSPGVSSPTVRSLVIKHVRPTQTRVVPQKLKDFVGLPLTMQANIVLSSTYQAFTSNVAKIPEPYSYQAVQSPEWCTAMASELAALEAIKLGLLLHYLLTRSLLGVAGYTK